MVTAGLDRRFVYPVTMLNLDWKAAGSPAEVLQALSEHRLLPVAGLLAERGLLRRDLVPLAEQLAAKRVNEAAERGAVEAEVFEALSRQGVRTLVLKGALLARTVYPAPEARIRSDLDVLVASESVEDACAALWGIGFAPSYEVHGGPPMTQAQWIRRGDSPIHAVDLHWDLSNRPLLKDRFVFEGLLERAQDVLGHGHEVSGLGAEDALLHACVHYFGHHRGEFRPDQWLLDMDLLWRSLDEGAAERLANGALSLRIGSLVAEGLRLSGERFDTPIENEWLDRIQRAARRESAQRLIRPPRFKGFEILRNASEERGIAAGFRHLRGTLFPSVAYMRRKYPGAPKWALPWLYVRRIWDGRNRQTLG